MKRFINADGILGANEDILSYNLYAYVSNNPINMMDPTGNWKLPSIKSIGKAIIDTRKKIVNTVKNFRKSIVNNFVAEVGAGAGLKGHINFFGLTFIDMGTSKDTTYTKKNGETTKTIKETGGIGVAGFGIYNDYSIPYENKLKCSGISLKQCNISVKEEGFNLPFVELNTLGDTFVGIELDLHFIIGGHIKIGWDTGNVFGDD